MARTKSKGVKGYVDNKKIVILQDEEINSTEDVSVNVMAEK